MWVVSDTLETLSFSCLESLQLFLLGFVDVFSSIWIGSCFIKLKKKKKKNLLLGFVLQLKLWLILYL
jgi:hypothetical protein